jgi:glyoxylase-like metal-dependent hydrolase (beta-lactamase superfamily II)
MNVTIQCLPVGPLETNCYIVSCDATKRAAIIDPGDEPERIVRATVAYDLQVDYILNTHAHPDHIGANCAVRERVGGRLLVHEADRAAVEAPPLHWLLIGMRPNGCPVDGTIAEGDELPLGQLSLRVMHTPGHSPGGVCFVLDTVVFTGDTLFAGGMGRTDFPGGSEELIRQSLRRLVTELPGETVVYPGHGEATTIAQEYAAWA